MHPDPHRVLKEYLIRHGLKASRQREVIADVFFNTDGHLLIEDLLQQARKVDARISQATVYRTMKLLTECGLASVRNFLDGQTRYERSDMSGEHHDHLICTHCGKIVEFVDGRIEELQERIARIHGFIVVHHKMELYGLCQACQMCQPLLPESTL